MTKINLEIRKKNKADIRKLLLNIAIYSLLTQYNYLSSNPVHCQMYSVQQYVIKFVSDLRQFGDFQWNWPPRYNYNIVESGVKHHKPNEANLIIQH